MYFVITRLFSSMVFLSQINNKQDTIWVNFSLRDRRKNHPSLAGIGNVVALTSPLQPRLPILWASEIAPTCSLLFDDSFILSWRIRPRLD